MDLEQIHQLSSGDMQGVNRLIAEQLHSEVALINQLGFYIVNSGGKRLRPLIAVLAARALGYQGEKHCQLAALIEFIHTSTLLHDDVVDESSMRRGRETANELFGNQASVLVGDYLYSRAFQLLVNFDSLRVMQVMANATTDISEGEVMQLMNVNDPDLSEASYFEVIYRKTAKLFEAASQLAAIISKATPEQEQAMADYGRHLGMAFQLVDDVLDYAADAEVLGKNLGDDLAEGKPTLPLLHALHNGPEEAQRQIRKAIEDGDGREQLQVILDTMHQLGSLDYVIDCAKREAEQAISALSPLPETPYKQALAALAQLAVARDH